MDPNNNGNLDLPLVGRDWRIEVPMEQWASLVQACQEIITMRGDEHLDALLQQALAVAVAVPPPVE